MECLNGIIGIAPDLCECLQNGAEPDQITQITSSVSGLYVSDLPGGVDISALATVDNCKSLAQVCIDALTSAYKNVNTDLIVALNTNYQGQKTFVGTLGQMSYTGTLPAVKRYQAFVLKANTGSDAIAKINRIGLIVNGSESVNVSVISAPRDSSMGTVVATYTINSVANSYAWFSVPSGGLSLPLSKSGSPIDYYFVYDSQTGAGIAPKDNKIWCNCPGLQKTVKTVGNYLAPMGMQLDDPNNLSSGIVDKYTRGILLDCELRCNAEVLVCGNYDNTEAVAVVLAVAAQFKAAELLIEGVMKTREVNRLVLQNKEYLWGKRNHFVTEYQNRILYLAKVIDVTASSCYICRDDDMYFTKQQVTDGVFQDQYEAINAINQSGYLGYNPQLINNVIPGVIPIPDKF